MPYQIERVDPITAMALEELGRTVEWLRRHHGLTQRSLGSASGLSQPTISRLERGRTPGMPLRTFGRVLAGLTEQVADTPEFRQLERDRPTPFWTVMYGSFGIGGRIEERLKAARARHEAEREDRLRALREKLRR